MNCNRVNGEWLLQHQVANTRRSTSIQPYLRYDDFWLPFNSGYMTISSCSCVFLVFRRSDTSFWHYSSFFLYLLLFYQHMIQISNYTLYPVVSIHIPVPIVFFKVSLFVSLSMDPVHWLSATYNVPDKITDKWKQERTQFWRTSLSATVHTINSTSQNHQPKHHFALR